VLATAVFTLFGVGGLLFVRTALRTELPLRAAAPEPGGRGRGAERGQVVREELDASVLVASNPVQTPQPAELPGRGASEAERAALDIELAERKQLEEHLLEVLLGEGRRDEKVALLVQVARSARADKLEWLTFAAERLPELPTAKGESLGSTAIGLIATLAEQDPSAREALDQLAFERPNLHVVLRREAAALAAERCPARECEQLRRRLLAEADRSVVSAALAALDRRADEPGVREWIDDFQQFQRPVEGEP
jgi:hypothetical protein